MPYIGKSPEMGVRTRYYYTVSAGATSVSGSDDNSKSLTFSDGEYVDVSLNGVALVAGTDYNTTTANTIAGLSAMSANDVIEVVVYDVFSVFSGDISGDLAVGGSLTSDGVLSAKGGVVFNEDSADVDFRVESNDNANMLFVDGGSNVVGVNANPTMVASGQFAVVKEGGSAIAEINSYRNAVGGSALILSHSRGTSQGSYTVLNDNDQMGRITWQGADGSDLVTEGAQIHAEIDGTPGSNDLPTALVFSTTSDGANTITERMRVNSSGNLLIGTTTDSGPLTVSAAGRCSVMHSSGTSNTQDILNLIGNGNTTNNAIRFWHGTNVAFSGGSVVGTIVINSSSTTYNTSSDYRLKENVTYNWDATSRLKQLKPARFNFKVNADTTVDGFLAHEVSSIVPEAITGEKDGTRTLTKVVLSSSNVVLGDDIEQSAWAAGKLTTKDADGNDVASLYPSDSKWTEEHVVPEYQGIDQSKLVPLLVKTIQELEARIKTLEDA
tara:strand:+ start:3806 stop:5293 length:1488 start_codon:yes stop_codon:yes gene_type:complete